MGSIEVDSTKVSFIGNLINEPYFSTWIGVQLVFAGVIMLLIATLYLDRNENKADWTEVFGMMVVCTGGSMYAISTFVNSPIIVSIGGIFLTLGLGLFGAFLIWQLYDIETDLQIDDPKEFKTNTENRSILGVISMLTVLIGTGCFTYKAVQRMVKPYLGPANYNLFGSVLFGAGAFAYMLLLFRTIEGADVSNTICHSILQPRIILFIGNFYCSVYNELLN
jgi:high-affinity Fe2+/Pb2+ permease